MVCRLWVESGQFSQYFRLILTKSRYRSTAASEKYYFVSLNTVQYWILLLNYPKDRISQKSLLSGQNNYVAPICVVHPAFRIA